MGTPKRTDAKDSSVALASAAAWRNWPPAALNRLAAKRRRLVNGIGRVALDPVNFLERIIEFFGDDLAQRG